MHAFDGSSNSTGPNPNPAESNMVRIAEWHFISQLPSSASMGKVWVAAIIRLIGVQSVL